MVQIATKLESATFLARPNRFVGEILINGQKELCHILNPGRMITFLIPGASVLVERREKPNRKLHYSLVYVEHPKTLILCDAQIMNNIVKEALYEKKIPEFAQTKLIQPEVKYGHDMHSRIDFLLDKRRYIEVKSSNYMDSNIGYFPDAPSERAQKHLIELMEISKREPEFEAWVFFVAQRTDVNAIHPFDSIDPEFGRLLRESVKKGVHIKCFSIDFQSKGLVAHLGRELPLLLD
jgi:sugar fermentation stimulation protein A